MRWPPEAQVMQVIEVKHCRGAGTEKDIARTVTTYYDLDGNILAENDPLPNGVLGER